MRLADRGSHLIPYRSRPAHVRVGRAVHAPPGTARGTAKRSSGRWRCCPLRLLAEAELLDERAVALEVPALQVGQEAAAASDKHQQPTARMMVLALLTQVLGQVVDALCEQGHLDLGVARV